MEADIFGPEHLVQDAGKDVFAGVLLHFVEPPCPVDAAGHGGAGDSGIGQGVHPVPDDAALLVDIGDGEPGSVRQGQGAVVGGLAAAFGVKDRAIQRELPAAPAVRFGSKDHGVSFAAVRIGLVVFLCGLHRSSQKAFTVPAAQSGDGTVFSSIPRFLPVENSLRLCYDRK